MASGFDNVDDAVCPPQRVKLVSATPQDASTENQGDSTWCLLTRWNTSERYVCTRSMKVTSDEMVKVSDSFYLTLSRLAFISFSYRAAEMVT